MKTISNGPCCASLLLAGWSPEEVDSSFYRPSNFPSFSLVNRKNEINFVADQLIGFIIFRISFSSLVFLGEGEGLFNLSYNGLLLYILVEKGRGMNIFFWSYHYQLMMLPSTLWSDGITVTIPNGRSQVRVPSQSRMLA